jgi:excisionase family DNA binding protein
MNQTAFLDADQYLSKRQASQYLGLSIRNLEQRLWEVPHFRVGGKTLFKKSELHEWMERYRANNVDIGRLADDVVKDILNRN